MYYVGKPNVPNRALFEKRLGEVLDNGVLTNDGPFVRQLEEEVTKYLDGVPCAAVANATLGLELVQRALGLTNKKVLVPPLSFIATAHAAHAGGNQVIFGQPEDGGYHMTAQIDHDVDGVIACNLFGTLCDVQGLEKECWKRKIPLIFDSAHALGVINKKCIKAGENGTAEVFSLHATKFVHGFEGGVVCSKDPELIREVKMMRNFGYDPQGPRHNVPSMWGTNAKMSEVHAAMALTNLEHRFEIVNHNQKIHRQYMKNLGEWQMHNHSGVLPVDMMHSNYQYVMTRIVRWGREPMIKHLESKGCFPKKYFHPALPEIPPYSLGECITGRYPMATQELLALPTGLAISIEDVDKICEWFLEAPKE